ncbi:hypothetical protein Pyn_27048 [Prunus yedoensis var. nudiflora]|uniref:Uncharacterized protein n=1 Tax=Prunus yedoensis var. nudiflora TaxID=2094558 RepID=A0A314YHY8_PRUYE|nr:hypothetical protein Pyn_27048 [Prunus yedoensis var. nudiflora]
MTIRTLLHLGLGYHLVKHERLRISHIDDKTSLDNGFTASRDKPPLSSPRSRVNHLTHHLTRWDSGRL